MIKFCLSYFIDKFKYYIIINGLYLFLSSFLSSFHLLIIFNFFEASELFFMDFINLSKFIIFYIFEWICLFLYLIFIFFINFFNNNNIINRIWLTNICWNIIRFINNCWYLLLFSFFKFSFDEFFQRDELAN